MQATIAFVMFSLCTISLAADVTIYNRSDYFWKEPQKLVPVAVSQFPWKFGYFGSDQFYDLYICISNKPPSVTAIDVTCKIDDRTFKIEKYFGRVLECYIECYIPINFVPSKPTEIDIQLDLYSSNILCSSRLVAKGRNVSNMKNEPLSKEFPRYGVCKTVGCAVVVDLVNKCDGPHLGTETKLNTTANNTAVTDVEAVTTFTSNVSTNLEITTKKNLANDTNPRLGTETKLNTTTNNTVVTDVEAANTFTSNVSTNLEITTKKNLANDTKNPDHQSSQNIVLRYVIPSVVGTCIITVVINLLWIKKCCRRNSPPAETMELNTAHTEPFYLNMLFRRECDQEIAAIEQPQYEEIDEHHYEEIPPQVTEGG